MKIHEFIFMHAVALHDVYLFDLGSSRRI